MAMAKAKTSKSDPRELRASLQAEIQAAIATGDTGVDIPALTAELRSVEIACADKELQEQVKATAESAERRAKLEAQCDALCVERDELYSVGAVEAGNRLARALREVDAALDGIGALQRRSRELNAEIRDLAQQIGKRIPPRDDILHYTRIASRVMRGLGEFLNSAVQIYWYGNRRLTLRDLWAEIEQEDVAREEQQGYAA